MKYFTREWQRGDLSEDDRARVSEPYDERLAAIAGSLPPGLRWDWIDMKALARRARNPETRILRHEVDLISPVDFEHSLLFAPRDHVTIRFSDVAISKVAVGERALEDEGYPFLEGKDATLQ